MPSRLVAKPSDSVESAAPPWPGAGRSKHPCLLGPVASPSPGTVLAGTAPASWWPLRRPQLEPNGNAVDLGLGLASLTVTRDGVKIAPPPFLHAAFQGLRRLQRRPGHKVKGANNRSTARLRRALAHATVADQHLDPLHRLGTGPIREHRTLCIEHLNGAGMAKNRKPARSIADAGWHLPRTILAARARMAGRAVQVASRWQPASRIGSACGDRTGKLPLSKRQRLCPDGRTGYDRDVNAAQTILVAALAARVDTCGAKSRSGWPAPAMKQEPT